MKKLYVCVSFVILLLGWQLLASMTGTHASIFPSPYDVVKWIFSNKERMLYHTWATAKEMGLGLSLATIFSLPCAYLMFKYRALRSFFESFFVLIQCLPMFTLAPLLIMLFGWSFKAIVIPIALMLLFPLTTALYKGITSTPDSWISFYSLHGASTETLWWKVRLPYALGHFFSGLRIASGIAGIGAVAGEWAGAQEGLGVYMQICRHNLDIEGVFAAIFMLLLLSLSFYTFIKNLEKWSARKIYAPTHH